MTLTGGFEPREYQRRIAETATASNTLVVLPTGLGKTMIAILVAASRLEKVSEGKGLVMAPTKPLTLHHYESFRAHFALPPRQLAVLTSATGTTGRTAPWTSTKILSR